MLLNVLEQLPLGAFLFNRELTVLQWNWVIEEWSRVSRKDIEGQPLQEFFQQFGEPRYRQDIEDCLTNRSSPLLFSPVLHKSLLPTFNPDGSRRTQVITISPCTLGEEEVYGLVTIQDISELTRASVKLQQANRRIEQEVEQRISAERRAAVSLRKEALSKLTTGFSHIINNKLQIIYNATELAEKRVGNPEEFNTQLERIRKISQETGKLSHTLLEFARESHDLPKDILLVSFLLDVKASFESSSKFPLALCDMNAEGESLQTLENIKIHFSPHALRRILKEVLNNAREATLECEERSIQLGWKIADPAHGEGRQIIITVDDKGEGMDASISSRAFDPFFTTRQGRNGIGLTIANNIAEQFGGRIRLESRQGVGTTVLIHVPQAV